MKRVSYWTKERCTTSVGRSSALGETACGSHSGPSLYFFAVFSIVCASTLSSRTPPEPIWTSLMPNWPGFCNIAPDTALLVSVLAVIDDEAILKGVAGVMGTEPLPLVGLVGHRRRLKVDSAVDAVDAVDPEATEVSLIAGDAQPFRNWSKGENSILSRIGASLLELYERTNCLRPKVGLNGVLVADAAAEPGLEAATMEEKDGEHGEVSGEVGN